MGGEVVDGGGQRCVVLELPAEEEESSATAGSSSSFDLERAVCSHGLFMMAPNRWDPLSKTLTRPLRLSSSSSSLLSPPLPPRPHLPPPFPPPPPPLRPRPRPPLSPQDLLSISGQVRRMLRISGENERVIREFHELHEGARESGFGRVFRSPTLFEDMVKCILLCNCQWPRSLSMARALCELQLELNGSKPLELFQPKTPQPKEVKRKRGTKHDAAMKLETKLAENEVELVNDVDPKPLSVYSFANSELPINSASDASITIDQIGDFPSPEELAHLDADYLAKRCKLGYRAQRIISLAKSIVEGNLEIKKLEDLCEGYTLSSYDKLDEELSRLSGFGPFTRANVLMCMGFYHKIPADSETIRHLKQFHRRSCAVQSVQKDIDAIYGKYAPYQFLAYWSELWEYYEKQFGKTSDMPPSHYQLITASNMRRKASEK
uniref:HhH-GPD domain-containing protein n=1 Tax=Ananas comosus var. bracteatus TaxID=296719 RepID=A0A6V7PC99_ANACO|nr:unnamed protein product [Ananas comosus var. bracteatus]